MEKPLILTFDYELCLGKDSGTFQKTLFEPTNIILDLLKKNNAKAVFFVDATYLLILKKNSHKDFGDVKKQIQNMIKNNCSVELHIHPQWIDAFQIDECRWSFKNFNRYRLHSLSFNEINKLFSESLDVLNNIIHEVKHDYKITAFRAGGWSIQPFDLLKDIFIKNGLLFDFSVQPGLFKSSLPVHYYNFKKAPKNLSSWKFNDDPVKIENEGQFYEIPVTTIKVLNLFLWVDYFKYRAKERNPSDNNDESSVFKRKSILRYFKIFNLLSKKYFSLSFDGLSLNYFNKFLKKAYNKNFRFLTGIAHPKTFSKSGIANLEYALNNFTTLNICDLLKIIQ